MNKPETCNNGIKQNSQIPKIIHQIYLGDNPLSEQELYWQKTWIDKNPDWSHVLWDDAKIESDLKITHPTVFENCKSFAEKSDILRLEILYQFGGLYVDTDFECLKNIDPLFQDREIVLFLEKPKKICNAFFGSSKRNSDVKRLIDGLPSRKKSHGNHRSVAFKYGPEYITEKLGWEIGVPDGLNCLKKTVYPYHWKEKHRRKEDFTKTHPEAHAVHHWNGSWLKNKK